VRPFAAGLERQITVKQWRFEAGSTDGLKTPKVVVLAAEDPDDVREREFGKRARLVPRGKKLKPDRRLADLGFVNELKGLDGIADLVDRVQHLAEPTPTRVLLAASGVDEKTGNGALRMLDVLGICHCVSGGRSQLVWKPGPRPDGEEPPRLLRARTYEQLVEVLRDLSEEWVATDFLLRELAPITAAGAVRARADGRPRGEDSSTRKRILGALKVLLHLDLVDTDKYGRQAVVWQWKAHEGRSSIFDYPGSW
jgi:hypothetical protein